MRSTIALSALALIFAGMSAGSAAQSAGALVPASFQHNMDASGNRWRFDQSGRLQLGTNWGNLSLQQMSVAGQGFSSSQPMMTPNGSELVLTGTVSNLAVTRRISFSASQSAARFVDIFQNTTRGEQLVSVSYGQQLGNQAQSILADDGSSMGQFGKRARALGAHNQNSGLDVLFVLADGSRAVRPVVNNNNNYQLDFSFTIRVPGGGRVSIVQTIAARPALVSKDAIARELKPFLRGGWLSGLARRRVGTIANITSRGGPGGELLPPPTAAEDLGLSPSDQDQLALGEGTLLFGNARCETFAVLTHEGRVTVPFDRVAAIVGERQELLPPSVYLRDGQRLAGTIELGGLAFDLAGGRGIPLELESLDRLMIGGPGDAEGATAPAGGDGDDEPATTQELLVHTHHGDRFLVDAPADVTMQFSTRWGELHVPLADILQVTEDEIGHVAILRGGTRFLGFLAGDSIALGCGLLGELRLHPSEIVTISSPAASMSAQEGDEGESSPVASDVAGPGGRAPAFVELGGGTRFIGPIDAEELTLWCAGQRIPLPIAQMRAVENPLEGARAGPGEPLSLFVDLWNGGRVEGEPADPRLGVLTRYGRVDVAAADVLTIQFARPVASLEERTEIASLIRRLGSADWTEREEASRQLAGTGRRAAPQLERALEVEEDPEVLRRVQSILEGLED